MGNDQHPGDDHPRLPARPALLDWPWALAALAVWALFTFGHEVGLSIAGKIFRWAKQPGTLSEAGGAAGMHRFEAGMAVVFVSFAALALVNVGRKLRGADRRSLGSALLPWAAWAVLVLVIRKVYIVYATEFVHFGQYAVVGAFVCRAIDRGRRPQVALVVTWALGFMDEVWQHYGPLHWGDPIHFFDWSDQVLDALGATGGILPFVTVQRARGEETPDVARGVRRSVLVIAALLLPLLLLDPVTTSWVLGHYHQFPFWGEYDNDKPTHWPGPREGIPLTIGALVVLLSLVDPRDRGLKPRTLLGLAALALIAIAPHSRKAGMPVHEVVPTVVARKATTPIVIDGVLDEPAWQAAQRLGPFTRNNDGFGHNDASGAPARHATHARVVWDARGIYFAFEAEDDDVWARDAARDDTTLPGDEVVEVFLDEHGDEMTYYEVEVSPKNVVYDLFNFVPQAPFDYNPDSKFVGLPQWSMRPLGDRPGIETAVQVRGTLDVVTDGAAPAARDADQGWTCELFFPWSALHTTTTTWQSYSHHPVPPRPGDRWRLGLYRVERPRPTPVAPDAPPLDVAAARAAIDAAAGFGDAERAAGKTSRFDALVASGSLKPAQGEGEGARFAAQDVALRVALEAHELQAWSPTQVNFGFHRPSSFGVLELAE